jgi:hypothetical protein
MAVERISSVLATSHSTNGGAGKTYSPVNGAKPLRMLTHTPDGVLGSTLFRYTDATGKPVIYVQRIQHHDGGKHFCQWGPTADGSGWQSNLDYAPKPRPLYRLQTELADSTAPIVFHEGEKAVEAAYRAGLSGLHTTTLAGAKSPHLSDFCPVSGRHVVVCPDNDQDGEHYAQAVTRLAKEAGALSVRRVALTGLPVKGDVVEWLEHGGTVEDFTARLDDALVVAEPPAVVATQCELMESGAGLNEAAYHGLAGEIVRLFRPHTEADPVALLVSFLSEVGAMLNRGPHLILDGTFHPVLFWPVLVGRSSKSRKGTAGKRIEHLLQLADPSWTRGECKGTLSSGEGLAFAVRDPQYREEALREKGRPTGETVTVLADKGVEDKRLFLVQSEFGAVLRVMARDGNSLSGVLRDAWDGQDLAPMTKANRIRASAPHIGIVGHVTKDELLRNLNNTEASNGFGNRFVWLIVQRSQELPFPSAPDLTDIQEMARKIGAAIRNGRTFGRLTLTESSRDAWRAIYHDLSADRPGLAGALLGRAEAQVMRLAGLYALLDGEGTINTVHLKAALAIWEYAEASTKLIFGSSMGDPVADTIWRELQAVGELDDSAISSLFSRNVPADKLDQAKALLQANGLAHSFPRAQTLGGRPCRVWKRGTK